VTKEWLFTLCQTLVEKDYQLLADYVEHLDKVMIVKSSTILGHLDSFSHYFKWICFHSPLTDQLRWCFDPLRDIIHKCRGSVNKVLKKEKSDTNTLSSKIERKRLPRDGFLTLNNIVDSKLDWIDTMEGTRPENIHKGMYNSVISAIISGHYCKLPTGRPRAFSFLQLTQMDDFRTNGFATSTCFKTYAKYGYQLILTEEKLLKATEIYVKTFRPVAVRNARRKGFTSNLDLLWLTYEGEQQRQIGKFVTKLFAMHDYHITTGDLRSLVETKANNAMLAGTLSAAQREAITDLNGHSSQVTKDYYLMTDRVSQSNAGREGFARMLGKPSAILGEPSRWPDEDVADVPVYGGQHPDKNNHINKRARWTNEEVDFIGRWMKCYLKQNPRATRLLSKLLHHIWKTPSCHPIFHPRHVLTTTRLKSGLDAYENKNGPIMKT
jgi:hypothetical protein